MPHLRMLNLNANQKLGECRQSPTTAPSDQVTIDDQNGDPSRLPVDGSEPQKSPSLLEPSRHSETVAVFQHDALRTLVLNNTGAPIEKLAHFLPKLPSLVISHFVFRGVVVSLLNNL